MNKVTVAKSAGFCFGVDRAVKMVYGELEKNTNVATLGPIIHNQDVVNDMQAKGARIIDTVDELKPDDLVIVDFDNKIVEGEMNPSSDTKTHVELYKNFENVGGIVHTHSSYAVGWAQAGRDIPCYGTTHADYFYGSVPCTRNLTQEEVDGNYELNTGKVIVETFKERNLDPAAVPGIICRCHGPFTWGKDAAKAVYHAVVLEEMAKMAMYTITIDPKAETAPQYVLDKHYSRKHGPNAYYGQGN